MGDIFTAGFYKTGGVIRFTAGFTFSIFGEHE
jgi:hypothetical protein